MQWQIEPMASWPYPDTKGRKGSPFKVGFKPSLELLSAELDHLRVQGAVAVRVVTDEADIRRDGMLRASAHVRHPGVAISFTSGKHGPLTYPCDAFEARYYGESWQANLRAIALGLQHLRALDRYGIAGRGEQYAGWRAIESGRVVGRPAVFATADDALRWLASYADLSRRDEPRALVREARKKAHPDVGGDPADWVRVDAAEQLLRRAGVIS